MKQYIVLLGEEIYHPECHLKTSRSYSTLKEARYVARLYRYSAVFRVHDDGYVYELKH